MSAPTSVRGSTCRPIRIARLAARGSRQQQLRLAAVRTRCLSRSLAARCGRTRAGGRFSGQFFGLHDSWAARPGLTISFARRGRAPVRRLDDRAVRRRGMRPRHAARPAQTLAYLSRRRAQHARRRRAARKSLNVVRRGARLGSPSGMKLSAGRSGQRSAPRANTSKVFAKGTISEKGRASMRQRSARDAIGGCIITLRNGRRARSAPDARSDADPRPRPFASRNDRRRRRKDSGRECPNGPRAAGPSHRAECGPPRRAP